jgi:insertion element IS1 protein InsB
LALELQSRYRIHIMCSDKNPAYAYYQIADRHVQSKSETCLVEAFNSSLRDMLARLNRRTKRISKSIEMLRLTLILFFNKEIAYQIYL